MSKQKLNELAALIADSSNSDSEYISRIFNEAVFERVKQKLKERNEFVYAAIKDIELSEGLITEAEPEVQSDETESDDSEESTDPEESDSGDELEFVPTDFDPSANMVVSLIKLNVDIEGLSDDDKGFIESYLNGELSDDDKQALLASIYGDGEWAEDFDDSELEEVEDEKLFETAEAFTTPTDDIIVILTRDEENNEIVVFASKSTSDVDSTPEEE